jgi:hypothetical protein
MQFVVEEEAYEECDEDEEFANADILNTEVSHLSITFSSKLFKLTLFFYNF